jgi:hypothetical protein
VGVPVGGGAPYVQRRVVPALPLPLPGAPPAPASAASPSLPGEGAALGASAGGSCAASGLTLRKRWGERNKSQIAALLVRIGAALAGSQLMEARAKGGVVVEGGVPKRPLERPVEDPWGGRLGELPPHDDDDDDDGGGDGEGGGLGEAGDGAGEEDLGSQLARALGAPAAVVRPGDGARAALSDVFMDGGRGGDAGGTRKRPRGAGGDVPPPPPPPLPPGAATPVRPRASLEPWELLTVGDLVVDIVTINFGKGRDDPVPHVMFYKTDRATGAIHATQIHRAQVSTFVPHVFEEQILRVYCRRREVEHVAHAAFLIWANDANYVDSTFFSPSARGRGGGGGGGSAAAPSVAPWTASQRPLPLSQTLA